MFAVLGFSLLELFGVVGLVALILFAGLYLINRQSAQRLIAYIRGQAGNVGRWAQNADPLTDYKQRIDDDAQEVLSAQHDWTEGEADLQGFIRAKEGLEKERKRLSNRIQMAVDKGDPNGTAKTNARLLSTVERQLFELCSEAGKTGAEIGLGDTEWADKKAEKDGPLVRQKKQMDRFTATIERGKKRINDRRLKAKELGFDLAMSEKEKKIAKMDEKWSNTSFGDSAAEVEERIHEQIDKNRAEAKSAQQFSMQGEAAADAADDELEHQTEAEKVLARFQKK